MAKKSAAQEEPVLGSLVHSAGIAGLLLAQFKFGILSDSTTSLTWGAVALATFQFALCLVPSSAPPAKAASSNKSSKSKDVNPSPNGLSNSLLATVLAVAMTPFVYFFLVIMGAPGLNMAVETALLALHVSLLATQRLFFHYALESAVWKKLLSLDLPLTGPYASSIAVWIGLWLGAIPIPLDWDRPWQQWPVTMIAGSYACAAIGDLVGGFCTAVRKHKHKKHTQ